MQILRTILGFLIIASANYATVTSCSADDAFRLSGKTMGPIRWNVTLSVLPDEFSTTRLETEIQKTLDRINDRMSTYQADSEISRFNQATSDDWFEVSRETAQVVIRALEISERTGGAFDITVGPAVNLWQFGPDKQDDFELPTDEKIEKASNRIGYQKLSARLDPPALKKSQSDVSIDLSAIAKGYAVDQVAETLKELGCTQFMMEVGGEVFAQGERPGGGNWRIGIEKPDELAQSVDRKVSLNGMAMATSGDYRNFSVVKGKRYSHTIDPATARPVVHSLASATVIAPDCMTADAYATAVMVLGPERGMKLCQQLGYELRTVSRDLDFGDKLTESNTENFPYLDNVSALDNKSKSATESIWPTLIGALVIFSLAVLGMAVGAIFGNKPVQGSCGGLSAMAGPDGETSCSVCSKPTTDCVEKQSSGL